MPQIFKLGPYYVYFWSNENDPLEPIHVHVAKGKPSQNTTKIWITESGRALAVNWKEDIAKGDRNNILRMIEANSKYIVDKWYEQFGEISYYC